MAQATELLRSKIAYNRLINFIFLQIAAPEPVSSLPAADPAKSSALRNRITLYRFPFTFHRSPATASRNTASTSSG